MFSFCLLIWQVRVLGHPEKGSSHPQTSHLWPTWPSCHSSSSIWRQGAPPDLCSCALPGHLPLYPLNTTPQNGNSQIRSLFCIFQRMKASAWLTVYWWKTGKWTHLPEAGGVPGFADGPVQPLVGSNVVSTALTPPGIFTCTQNQGVERLKKQGVRGQDPYLLEEYGVKRLWCWKG